MTFNEMCNFVAFTLLQRGGDIDVTSAAPGGTTDLTLSIAGQLINQVKRDLMADPRFHWTACESHVVTPYLANGLPIAATVREVYAVWEAEPDADMTGGYCRGREIDSTTVSAVIQRGEGNRHHHHHHAFEHHHHEQHRWYIQERALWLTDKRLVGKALWLDELVYLPDYAPAIAGPPAVAAVDTDWFSVVGSNALVYKAASLGSLVGWESERLEEFRLLADGDPQRGLPGFIKNLYEVDQRLSDGGVADIARPTVDRFM